MTLAQKRKTIDIQNSNISITKQCEWLTLNRSSLYYKPLEESDYNLELMREMDELHLIDPIIGSRRFCVELQKKGYKVCRDKVRRLMKLMRLFPIYCRPKTTISDPVKYKYPYLLRGLEIVRRNQVWMVDITYVPMQKGFLYFVGIIDVYSRKIVGWSISNSMDARWVCNCVKSAIEEFGKPEIINSDQGSQFTSDEYITLIKSYQTIQISMDGKGRAIDNVYIERFFRTLKYDKLYICPADDGLELFKNCDEFIAYYNSQRGHSSLAYETPDNVYNEAA